jgi:predicted ATP-binding protein involved in virulence
MFIERVDITNFKGFEKRNFEFKSHFTVAIGNNGLGKSTLLNALQVGLGGFLQSMPKLQGNKYRRQFKPSERFLYFDKSTNSYVSNDTNPLIEIHAQYGKNKFYWKREYLFSNTTTHNQRDSQQIIDFANKLYKLKTDLYPVLANFETNRANAEVGKVDKSWKRTSRLHKGYFSALNDTVNFKGVYEWLESYDNSRKLDNEFKGTREAFYNAIKTAIPYIQEIEYTKSYGEFEIIIDFKDGQQKEWRLHSSLSDGTKAMLNMVSEIAYRCIMLNGKLGAEAVLNSPGIVLIDELDMHLHPNWQRHVVANLKSAFPKIQFIVTTHSPFIVQSLESTELINLDKITDVKLKDLSIGEVAEDVMGTSSQMSEENKLDEDLSIEYLKTLDLLKTKDNTDIINKLNKLEIEISDPGVRALIKMKRLEK